MRLVPIALFASLLCISPLWADTPENPDIEKLSQALRIETISHDDPANRNMAAFNEFHDFLKASFPRVHAELERERVGDYSLLYHWPGRQQTSLPVLLTAHMDVVPVREGDVWAWDQPPFSGAIAGDRIYGRGAFDNKIQVITLLGAAERLLAEGYQPPTDVYFAFGHDEELGGGAGARAMAKHLATRVGRFSFVLDEGGGVLEGTLLGDIPGYIGLIGIAEKGEVNLTLRSSAQPGFSHSSSPGPNTPVTRLARALVRLADNPFDAKLTAATSALLDHMGAVMTGLDGVALRNRWLFQSVVRNRLASRPASNAMIRTTMVPTMISGSTKANSIPEIAEANVNIRILPGDTIESVVAHVTRAIDDPAIEISVKQHLQPRNPRPASDTGSRPYQALARLARTQFPDATFISPWLIPGGTDARHYRVLSDHVFGFTPVHLTAEQLQGPHGIGEWVTTQNVEEAGHFYRQLFLGLEAFLRDPVSE